MFKPPSFQDIDFRRTLPCGKFQRFSHYPMEILPSFFRCGNSKNPVEIQKTLWKLPCGNSKNPVEIQKNSGKAQ